MEKVIQSIKSLAIKRNAAFIFCVFLYAGTLLSGLANFAQSSESVVNLKRLKESQLFSNQNVSNSTFCKATVNTAKSQLPENNYLFFESNENEEEVDSDKLGIESSQDNFRFSIPISNFLNNYSHQLSKRKIIPLFVLYSSWKSYLFS